MKSSARTRQTILGITSGEIPEEEIAAPPGSVRVFGAGSGCTCSETGSGRTCSYGARSSLNPVRRIRRFSPRCEL